MRFFIIVCLLLTTTLRASAWAQKGHAVIADLASAGLSSNAKAHVAALLQGRTMSQVASWADEMRTWQRHRDRRIPPASLAADPEASTFLQDPRNNDQPSWHFVDLPLGATRYRLGGPGTRPDDIVQVINRCIAVLKGHPFPGENLDQPQALRLLIHLVGDLHQPLHASCGYWIAGPGGQAALASPAQAAYAIDDHGANALKFGKSRDTFHYLWDGHMVDTAQHGQTKAQYVRHLASLIDPLHKTPWTLSGNPEDWAAQWAKEFADTAAIIYKPLDYSRLTVDMARKRISGTVSLPPNYDTQFTPIVNKQLARAGFRLAALLNAIWH